MDRFVSFPPSLSRTFSIHTHEAFGAVSGLFAFDNPAAVLALQLTDALSRTLDPVLDGLVVALVMMPLALELPSTATMLTVPRSPR